MPDPPAPLLLERRIETGDDVYVDRITVDGGVWTGGTVTAKIDGEGQYRFERIEPTWQREGTLPGPVLDRLRTAITASGFFDTPPEHHPVHAVIHASHEVWTAELDGRRHTSRLLARGTITAEPLAKLAEALEAALAAEDG